MKKILLSFGVFVLTACTDKPVSLEYYNTHITEAKEQLVKCANNKDENSLSCENADKAIQAERAKKIQEKTINNLR